jgi:glycosyltransferase involved in cell wall biosynthesis
MISGDRSLAEGKHGAFYNTLEEFHKYWDRIDIICPKPKGQISNVKNIFGNVFVHSSRWPLIFQPFWILKKGQHVFKEQKFELMLVHEYPPFYNGIGARWLWNKIKVPYVLEILHIPGYPKAANLKEKVYKIVTKLFIKCDSKKAKAVRIINRKQVAEFLLKAGIQEKKLSYIPAFYIDFQIFKPIAADKKFDLVFAARLEKNKGITLLLEAIRSIKLQNPNIKLLIIGSGPEKENLLQFIKKEKLESNVQFSGWLETANDVALAYNSGRIFVNPSFNEGGPRVMLEAMACGLPIITTKVGVALDVIEDGNNGIFVSWKPEEIAEKILYLLDNTKLQEKFSGAGLETVKQFEKSVAIKNFAEKLQSLI